MLFTLSNEIQIMISNPASIDPEIYNMLHLVAMSVRSGNHCFYSKRKLLKEISNLEILNDVSRRVYLQLYNNSSELKYIEQTVKRKVVITVSDVYITDICPSSSSLLIGIPYMELTNLKFLRSTKLLCEDLTDIEFYKLVTRYYIKNNNLNNFKINLVPQGGGGLNIAREYSQIMTRCEDFCLCIADSDKKSPANSYGRTFDSLNRIFEATDISFISDVLVLSVREAENLIPFEIIEKIYEQDINYNQRITLHKALFDQVAEAKKYFDFKKGIRWKDVKDNKLAHELFWYDILQNFGIITDKSIEKFSDEDFLLNGYDSRVLLKSTTLINDKYINHSNRLSLGEIEKKDWDNIAKNIIDWCCSSPKIYVS